jgi:lysophospholipase L1-like esterase
MAKRRFIGTWWFLVLFNFALFVLLAEITLRVTGKYKNYGERNYGLFIDYFKHPYPSPLCAWTPNMERSQETAEFSYLLKTNSLGIRDTEHNIKKPTGMKRAIILGDSFTEGMGTEFDSTWPQRLAWYLTQDTTLSPWEIIVGGVSGSDPFYAYEMLRRNLMDYEPDLVLVAYNFTEVTDFTARGGMERFVNESTTQLRAPKSRVLNFAYKWSHLVRMIVKDGLGWNDYYQSPEEQQQLQSESISAITKVYVSMDSLVRTKGAKALFVFQPLNYECHRDYFEPITDSIIKAVDTEGLEYMSLLASLPDSMKEDYLNYYWPIDGHMNGKGYDAWGRSVYAFLKGKTILTSKE